MREFFIAYYPTAIWFIVAAEGLIAVLLFQYLYRRKEIKQ